MDGKYLYDFSLNGHDYVINCDEIINEETLKSVYLKFLEEKREHTSLLDFMNYLVQNYGFYWANMDVIVNLNSTLKNE